VSVAPPTVDDPDHDEDTGVDLDLVVDDRPDSMISPPFAERAINSTMRDAAIRRHLADLERDPRSDPRAKATLRGALSPERDGQANRPPEADRPAEPATDERIEPDVDAPRVFTIADARLRLAESIQHLPVLGADGYIVKGWTHLLAGWWRLGKSELMAVAVLPWLRLAHRVLWITEEADSIWADRADEFDDLYPNVPWDRLVLMDAYSGTAGSRLDAASRISADVVIVDTVREVCQIVSMKDDDAVRAAVSPWLRRLRDGRRTLIFIAQHRKAAGERGERVEGSVALPSMMDVVLELEAVDGHDRQRRLSVRRRRSQTAPLLFEMDDEDRLVVIPDARSRSRVEAEAAALAVIADAAEPLTSVEVRRRMTPRPSRDTVRRVLTAHAEAGRILRDPPIAEAAGRRAVRWTSATSSQLDLAQNFTFHTWKFAAPDDSAPDNDTSDAFTEGSA
jgi:hypothetical protein